MLNTSIKNQQRSLAPLLFLCLALSGCANIGPFVEPHEADPLPEGPGLFSGETGEFSIGGDTLDSKAKAEPGNTATDAASFAEFEAYQRWKTEERNSDEYREFQQWLQYKKWKRQQPQQ